MEIQATWSGQMWVVAIAGNLSLYRSNSYSLALLALADSLGTLTVEDVDQVLLAGQRRQIARRMLEQVVRDRGLELDETGRYVLTTWGRASLKDDKAAWIEHSEGAWMLLLGDQFEPLFAKLPLVPVAPVDEKSDADEWQGLAASTIAAGDVRYPGLTKLMQELTAGNSIDGWFGQRREKLLINPLSNPAKVRARQTKVELVAHSDGAGGWSIAKVDFPQMRSLGKMATGLKGQSINGVKAEYFDGRLAKAGYRRMDGGLYQPNDANLASSQVDLSTMCFRHRLTVGNWDVKLTSAVGASHLEQALDWFVQHGLNDAGIGTMEGLMKQASVYLRKAGIDPVTLDQATLRAAFQRQRPLGLNRAARSRTMYPLYFN